MMDTTRRPPLRELAPGLVVSLGLLPDVILFVKSRNWKRIPYELRDVSCVPSASKLYQERQRLPGRFREWVRVGARRGE